MSSPEGPDRLDAFHWAFHKLYPAIRFTYERLFGHAWFTQITPSLWIGGAPTYRRDYDALIADGITAVLDVRAEGTTDFAFYDAHGISHQRFHVPDIGVPDEEPADRGDRAGSTRSSPTAGPSSSTVRRAGAARRPCSRHTSCELTG